MALTFAPLLALPLAGALMRRAGYRYDAWVLPLALAFHWLLFQGLGTHPVYLVLVTLFVLTAGGAACVGLATPRRTSRPTLVGDGRRRAEGSDEAEPVKPSFETPPTPVRPVRSRARTPVPPFVPEPPPAAVPAEVEPPVEVASEPPTPPGGAVERVVAPPRDEAELVDRIEACCSDAQRGTLVAGLRSEEEVVALVRTSSDSDRAALGAAHTVRDKVWGPENVDGLVLSFEGVAPRDTTVLVALCDVTDPAEIFDDAERDAARGAAILVPTSLFGVKRLDDGTTADARWIARSVFVPLHLVVGEVDSAGRGPGHGEVVTGRPS
ncbi:MAG: hypothetical protein AAGI22_13220 [Planctomycetota bacterium]